MLERLRPWRRTREGKRLPLDELRRRARIVVIDDDPHAFPSEILREEGYNIDDWTEVKSVSKLEDAAGSTNWRATSPRSKPN